MSQPNFHTHSHYCDGAEKPINYVKKGIELEMPSLGFSSHAPVTFENKWSMNWEDLDTYRNEIKELKEQYKKDIEIYRGLEIDYIPGISKKFDHFRNQLQLDYVIGAVHLVKSTNTEKLWFIDGPQEGYKRGLEEIFKNDPRKAVTAYFYQINEMLHGQEFEFIAHLDKVKMNNKEQFFSTKEPWYKKLVKQTLTYIKDKDVALELNTRGVYKGKSEEFFPSTEILQEAYTMKIPVVVNSDAHSPHELNGCFTEALSLLKDIGYKGVYVLKNGTWQLSSI